MRYAFGQDFNYVFTPYVDGEPTKASHSHTAKLLVYSTEPSRSQVTDETGQLATYTTTWESGASSMSFSVEAIDDPRPTDTDKDETYWVGIKYLLESGGQTQIVIRALLLERSRGTSALLDVTVADIEDQFKQITTYVSPVEILDQIAIQKELLKVELESKGYEWAQIWRPDKLKRAVVFATLGALCANESKRDGDQFDKLSRRFDTNAQGFLKVVSIEYDQSDNSEPDAVVQGAGFSVVVR